MVDFSKVKLLSFDCYGTLVDWKKSVLDILQPLFARYGYDAGREELFRLFLQEDRDLITSGYQTYRTILARIVNGMAAELDISLHTSDRTILSDGFDQWLPFGDTVHSLKMLKKRFRLAIISNVDEDLFITTADKLGVEFDHLILAGKLKSYKPAALNFETAIKLFNLERSQVVHVAQSIHHDILPSNQLDWQNIWVNRYGETERTDPAEFPDLEVPDLQSLVKIIDMEMGTL